SRPGRVVAGAGAFRLRSDARENTMTASVLHAQPGGAMARKEAKSQKSQIVACKVEEELAEFLDKLPNKSEFIRKAILAQFGMTCPLCTGSGVVARGIHDHFRPVIAEHSTRPCEK